MINILMGFGWCKNRTPEKVFTNKIQIKGYKNQTMEKDPRRKTQDIRNNKQDGRKKAKTSHWASLGFSSNLVLRTWYNPPFLGKSS
jgi:hypothetical protein